MPKFHQLRKFVLALSGAREEILDAVPSEQARFESLGWAILITSCMAVISMWFALANALSINGIVAFPVAIFWGLVIMGIDRWLIISMPIDGRRKFAMAVPRVLLALLLGTLISTPLVLRIFQSEINAQMATMQSGNYNTFLTQQNGSQVAKQVTDYADQLTELNTVINSHGAQTGDTAEDPELKTFNNQLTTLDAQLAKETALRQQYYTQYRCQRYGGPGCPAGLGPAAKASLKSYNEADAQVTKLQGEINTTQSEIQARDKFLASTSKSNQLQRYQEALQQRPIVQGEYNTAVQRKNQLQAAYYAQEQASHGILMRLEALSELSSQSFTVTMARFLLFLLFLVIECLPVTVKLLQKPGQYEAALRVWQDSERRDFSKAFDFRSRFAGAGYQPGSGRRVLQATPEPEPDTDRYWNGGGGTKVLPISAGDFEDQRPTEVYQERDPAFGRPVDGRFAKGAGDFAALDTQTRQYTGDGYHKYWGQRADDASQAFGRAPGQDAPAHGNGAQEDAGLVPPTRIDVPAGNGRPDPWAAAQTRVDHGFSAEGASGDGYLPMEEPADGPRDHWPQQDFGHGSGDDYRPQPEPRPGPAALGAGQASQDGNGSGVPLDWGDE
jgi:Domain of unknown function (DUF4407)